MDERDIFRRCIEPYIAEMRHALQGLPEEDLTPEMRKEHRQLEEAICQLEALMGGK